MARHPVTEYRTRQVRCTCGHLHQRALPEDVNEVVQYGPNVRALAVHLAHGQLLPVACSARFISELFALNPSRAATLTWIGEAAKPMVSLPRGMAVLVHHCWPTYWDLDCVQALCNAHLLRELTFVHESTKQPRANRMMGLLRRTNRRCEAARQAGRPALSPRQIQWIDKCYTQI